MLVRVPYRFVRRFALACVGALNAAVRLLARMPYRFMRHLCRCARMRLDACWRMCLCGLYQTSAKPLRIARAVMRVQPTRIPRQSHSAASTHANALQSDQPNDARQCRQRLATRRPSDVPSALSRCRHAARQAISRPCRARARLRPQSPISSCPRCLSAATPRGRRSAPAAAARSGWSL